LATLGDLLFRTAHKSGLNDSVPDEHQLMLGWARDGVTEVLLETHAVIETGITALTPNVNLYTIDPLVLVVVYAQSFSGSQAYDIEVMQLERLRVLQRAQGTSPVTALAIEGDRLYVYPTPSQADTITWDFVPRPTQPLTNPSDDPSTASFGRLPTEYHRAIEYYMLWQAGEYDDKKIAQSPDDLFKRFIAECGRVRRNRQGKQGRAPMRPMVGYPGRANDSVRNDQDILYTSN
jgi:hypothetical protein